MKYSDTDLLDFYEVHNCFHGINSRGEHFVHVNHSMDLTFKGKSFRDAVISAMKGYSHDREAKRT